MKALEPPLVHVSAGACNPAAFASFPALFALACALSLVCGCSSDFNEGDAELARGETHQPVLLGALGHFDILDRASLNATERRVADSQGMMRRTLPDGSVGTCGVTFVSPHYAVTAAHCVADVSTSSRFTVRSISYSGVDSADVLEQSEVVGIWPNWSQAHRLNWRDGYRSSSMNDCRMVRRCSGTFGERTDCPGIPFWGPMPDVDLALLYCPSRSGDASWVEPVGTRVDAIGREVEAYWFHEVVSLFGVPPSERGPHYVTSSKSARLENYHYRGLHQYLPLRFQSFADGSGYRALYHDNVVPPRERDRTTWTDIQGCHGTSGSGIFVRGTAQYLGPATTGGGDLGSQLCVTMRNSNRGRGLLGYVQPWWVALLVGQSFEVQVDR